MRDIDSPVDEDRTRLLSDLGIQSLNEYRFCDTCGFIIIQPRHKIKQMFEFIVCDLGF